MEITLESYIDYCSNMDITTESFSSVKAALISGFSRLVLWIESKVKKMKDSKTKSILMKLLSRAKQGLSKSKSLNEHNPEMVKKLQEEMSVIKEETKNVNANDYAYFYISSTWEKLVSEKDYGAMKALLVGIIGSDPTWCTTEFDEAISYLKKNGISISDLTDSYKLNDGENDTSHLSKLEWTEEVYQLLLLNLRYNFNLDKRLPLIKEMGKYVYKNKNTYGKNKFKAHHN